MRTTSRYIITGIVVICSLTACKKVIENEQKKAVMSFITNGRWVVTSYLVDTVEISDQFSGYRFQFKDDGSVTGDNGTVSVNGTWVGEVSDYSITSQFPAGQEPFVKLNGHWIIKDSGTTFVKADLNTETATMHLHLTKVP